MHVRSIDSETLYLGDAKVAHGFVGAFAHDVMLNYDRFLSGKAPGAEVLAEIRALVKCYGDALMGRDDHYQIAAWQGKRLKGKFLAALPKMKGDDEPGEAMFDYLALQCVKASLSLRDGKRSDEEIGEMLREILDDAVGRILGQII